MPKLLEVTGETDTKIYCQAIMLDMHPCSATDHQSGSDYGWKSSKTIEVFFKKENVFLTN
jgi:hypothetical protein